MTTSTTPQPTSLTRTEPSGIRLRLRRSTPRWWRDGTAAAAWALVLFVVGLWVGGGALGETGLLGSAADAVTSLGRLAGLEASVLILIQVALMARIPVVEQAWGQDELARVHRLVGFTSFSLMLAHIVLTIVGYAVGVGAGVLATFVDEVLGSPGMLLALAGSLALVMVVVTSIRRARARLRYESWHLLHLYAYLGAGLALPHQLWTGQDFRASSLATVFWWGLYAAVLASVVAFRVVLPLIRSRRHALVVREVVAESPDVVSVVVEGRDLERLPARGGQFFQWRFLGSPGWTRANPYSLSAAPDGRTLRLTAKLVGDSSRRLPTLTPGTKVLVEGPYGRLHAGVAVRDKYLLVGAGIGMTPLRALLEELPAGPGRAVLVYRATGADDLVLGDELAALARTKGAEVVSVLGPRARSRASWLPEPAAHLGDAEALRTLAPDIAERDVYVCGTPEWMDHVIRAARAAGVPAEAIHHERFAY
ncbi:ferric reductase-like transmembrane domain-containing protein [Intrasporangium sp. DVR]|uniref:ferredoxin reductase family protein n=1 Tax=Intrasporangium sp. DVR TaxID=3127867 RepID=UPI00313A753E